MAIIKYSGMRSRKIDITIWTNTEKMCAFGFAANTYKPESLPYATREKAEQAARKLVKSLIDTAIADGSNTVNAADVKS